MTVTPAHRPRVFLSYSRPDTLTAERLRPLLKLAGFDPLQDSASLSRCAEWEAAVADAMSVSDFVVALLSPSTRAGRQLDELRLAVGGARPGRRPGMPLVLPCALVSSRDGGLADVIPDGLQRSHVLDLSDVDVGWRQLHAALYRAGRAAGFWVPMFLRATPIEDLDASAVMRMIAEKAFFSTRIRQTSVSRNGELTLAANDMVVVDRGTGRVWTRGCLDGEALPHPPHATADEESAGLTLPEQRTDEQHALLAARQTRKQEMRRAVEDWILRANVERLGGYDDWRLPTVEEAMSLTTPDLRHGGLYLSPLFSDHEYIRTADRSLGPRMLGRAIEGWESVWIVSYTGAECLDAPEEGPFPLRFVRTDLD